MTRQSNLPPPFPKLRRSRLVIASAALALIPIFGFLLLAALDQIKIRGVVVSVVFIASLISLVASPIFSVAALVAIWMSRGRRSGWGIAILSFGLGVLSIAFFCSNMVMVERVPSRMRCAWNLKHIHIALDTYFYDNGDHYPPSLSCLYPKYTNDLSLFQCPSAKGKRMTAKFDEQLCSYRYIYYPDESVKLFDVDRMILAFDKGKNHHMKGMNVMFPDGGVNFMLRENLIDTLSEMVGNKKLSMPTRDAVRKVLTEVIAEGPVKRESP